MKKLIKRLLITSLVIILLPIYLQANVRLPVPVSDGIIIAFDHIGNGLTINGEVIHAVLHQPDQTESLYGQMQRLKIIR